MNTNAPIAIFAFKRLDLLQQTLSALEKCVEFDSSLVYVFSDAARKDRPDEAEAVGRLRLWLSEWCVRQGAKLHESAENKGLRPSIISGVATILKAHDRVIVLEDDIIVSPSFLKFMNEALEVCHDRANIFQVSGYFIPHRQKLPPVGLLRVPACWGWATWRRAWNYYNDDAAALLAEIRRRDVHAFNINGTYDYFRSLEANAAGTMNTWMVRWYASVFLQGGQTVYPGRSLTRNIGFGEGGTNCGAGSTDRTFMRQKINSDPGRINWNDVGTGETPSFALALEGFYRWQQDQWTKPTWRQRWQSRWKRLLRMGIRA